MPGETARLWPRLRGHIVETVKLAAPVVVTRAGILVMAAVDTAMLGRTHVDQVAFYGISVTPFIVIIVAGIGLLFGTVIATSHAIGRDAPQECGAIWRRSLPYALAIGVIGLVFCQFGGWFFDLAGQPPVISEGGGRVIAILGLSLPGVILYCTTAFFLEGLRRPVPAMLVMIVANILNVWFNWLLIFGNGGFPALGAEGAAWSTTLVRLAMPIMLMAYVWWMPDRDLYGVRGRLEKHWWRRGRLQRGYGYATSVSYTVEESAFAALGFFAGLMGTLSLAAYTVQNISIAFVFMAALGVASATSVRVGIAHGRGDWSNRSMAAWTGMALALAALGVVALGFLFLPATIAAIFTSDPVLIATVAPLIALSAFLLMCDGGQVVMANILRGAGETWAPPAIHVISYFLVMLPLGWILAFSFEYGVRGLVLGIIAGSVVSITLLSARFLVISRRSRRLSGTTAT